MAAKNTIKGLTVEIGGDTTKLGKALEDIDKQSGDLGKELSDINRLLKFNPEDTELLAQKQKVLGDVIGNTSKKLDTLKEAEKQVQAQFKRGEVSEAQVRALQREIIETESKLENYRKQAENAGKATEDLGDKSEGLGNALSAVGTGLSAITGAASAVVGALVGMAEETREYRTEMAKLDTAFVTNGFSSEAATKAYKQLQGVLGESDQAVEAASHLAQLTDNEKDLAKWTGIILPGVFATFGASLPIEGLTEAANETAKVGKVTGSLADALNWAGVSEEEFNAVLELCTTAQERQAVITKELTRLYGDAALAYKLTNAELIKSNQANEEWMATMAEAGAAVDPILTDVKLLGASLLMEFIPGITEAANAVRGLLNGEDGAADTLGAALSNIITQLLDKVVTVLPQVIEMVMSLALTIVDTVVSMTPQIVSAVFSVVVAILGEIGESLPLIVQSVAEVLPQLVSALLAGTSMLIEAAIELLLSIIDAVPVLISALLPQVPAIVQAVVNGLLDNIDMIIDCAIKLFFGILEAVPEIIEAVIKEVPSIVTSIVDTLLACLPDLVEAGGDLLAGLIKGMLKFDWFSPIKAIGDGIVGGFKKVFDIHSPSRVMAGLGEMLDQGLAVGIEDNAKAPVNALDALSEDMVDTAAGLEGLTLERRMEHTFADMSTPSPASGVMSKLDQIYRAILAGQVIMLDSKVLIGSTAEGYDSELGMRRVLAERGAL